MSSNFKIRNPFRLATLPKPLDPGSGQPVSNRVYGRKQGRTRKRPEVVVGIQGQAVNIYDISNSLIITSYPVSLQESFVCSPYSIRESGGGTESCRRTFIVTEDPNGQRITLFKDVVSRDGKITPSVVSRTIHVPSRILYLDVMFRACCEVSNGPEATKENGSLFAVCLDGNIIHLSFDTLSITSTESTQPHLSSAISGPLPGYFVEFAALSTVSGSKPNSKKKTGFDLLSTRHFPSSSAQILYLVSRITEDAVQRRFVLLFRVETTGSESGALHPILEPMSISPLPSLMRERTDVIQDAIKFDVEFSTGHLFELRQDSLAIYDVSGTTAHCLGLHRTQRASFFTRISGFSTLLYSPDAIRIYNYKLWSLQGAINPGSSSAAPDNAGEETIEHCCFSGYFRDLRVVVAVVGNALLSIPLEQPRREIHQGLLIDSIGRGESRNKSNWRCLLPSGPAATFRSDTSALVTANNNTEQIILEMDAADSLIAKGELSQFNVFLASKLGLALRLTPTGINGNKTAEDNVAEWQWLSHPLDYPPVDHRWILYTLRQALLVSDEAVDESGFDVKAAPSTPNSFIYLVVSGKMTVPNFRAAFKLGLFPFDLHDRRIAEKIVQVLMDVDPTMVLLVDYISSTVLGATELVVVVKALLNNLGLVEQFSAVLASEVTITDQDPPPNGKGKDLDGSDQRAVTEYQHKRTSGAGNRGLAIALAKLESCPSAASAQNLRLILDAREILALIYVLRLELVKGDWTSRYIDRTDEDDTAGNEGTPRGVMSFITTLLGRCLDAVGPGDWLLVDSSTGTSGEGGVLGGLRDEVQAALIGLEEAVYLKGVLGEFVSYASGHGKKRKKAGAGPQIPGLPMLVHVDGREQDLLPLQWEQPHSSNMQSKIVAGGELVQRTGREVGQLKSHTVQEYSLERVLV